MDKVIIAGLLTIAGVITAVILFGGLTESVQEAGENTKTTMAQSCLLYTSDAADE